MDELNTNGKTDDEILSKSHNAIDWEQQEDEIEIQSTTQNELDRTNSDDLSTTSYTLIDELFLELFYRGIKQYSLDDNTSLFTQLNQDQREIFRKIIKHFCNLDKRLDDMLDL
jgi:hypothetical protein